MSSLWKKVQFYGLKSRVFYLYSTLHAYISCSLFAIHAYEHMYGFIQLDMR